MISPVFKLKAGFQPVFLFNHLSKAHIFTKIIDNLSANLKSS